MVTQGQENFFFVSLFILRERERDSMQAGEGQRERLGKRERESQAGSALSAQRPIQVSNSQTMRL